ncbi:hypothetical protein O9992_22075 [Vibrio lentus]|nr:hypothetical protein [Vibrio lentus]
MALCLFLLPALAYQEGDSLSPNVIEKLQLNNDELTIIASLQSGASLAAKELPEVNQLYTPNSKHW